MSDPLTALMHAVQVMNLLKTLIMKTLREREETTTAGYSPMSFRSSDRQSEDGYDSHQEMETSGELRTTKSDYDEHAHYSHSSEEEEEVGAESLSDIEESFLKQLDEHTKEYSEESAGDLQEEYSASSPISHSGSIMGAAMSFTNRKYENSCLSCTHVEKSSISQTTGESKIDMNSPSLGCAVSNDVEMVNKFTGSVSPVPMFTSS